MATTGGPDDASVLQKEFMEPSLLSLLVHEPQKKVRLNALSALVILFDTLAIAKWVQGQDFERYEKQQSGVKQAF